MRTYKKRNWIFGSLAIAAALLASGLHQAGGVAHAQAPVGQGFNLNASDLRFILKQTRIAERHAGTATASDPCGTLVGGDPDQIPVGTGQTIELPWGLRTVDGSCNHLTPGQEVFGTSDQVFPRVLTKELRDAEPIPPGFGPPSPTSYTQVSGTVVDSQPRLISNLIVDQTANNPSAVEAAGENPLLTPSGAFFIPNTAPDVGLSAPFNSWFTLFGQFFDHGLDLVSKGGNGLVFIPLRPDDPLYPEAAAAGAPFMVLTRATHGGDHEAFNQTSPWVDQSQTYTSHPSHQVFLREYHLVNGKPAGTGRLITGKGHGMATWADVKAQALHVLGIELSDADALSIPLLATDPYGRFLRGPSGFPQVVKVVDSAVMLVEGNLLTPVNTADTVPTGHAFLDDIAHAAVPGSGRSPDPDSVAGIDDLDNATYDDEMLNAHFIAGDGRVNENIGLTAVHHIFHSEHNRLVLAISDMIASDPGLTQAERDTWNATDLFGFGPERSWDFAERLFQAARFVTEMQYQHLAFEEFIRKVQPMVNLFGEGGVGFNPSVNPAIRAEFAHAVYRFGHSMLTEVVGRINAAGHDYSISLFDAFLNPPSFFDGLDPDNDPEAARKAAGSIIRGMTTQVGNEIDEFVTEALRNRLLGLPLDLPALNMARSRDTGIPRLNEARRQFFAASQNSALAPYKDWANFGLALRHPTSLVNFLAAYGAHSTITGETTLAGKRAAAAALVYGPAGPDGVVDNIAETPQDESADNPPFVPADRFDFLNSIGDWSPDLGRTITGVDDIDLWVGGLAEKGAVFGGLLGPTFNYVFEKQMEDLQDGDRFYYLARTAGLNLLVQLEGNSFSELISRNTDAQGLPADVFSRPAFSFNLAAQTNPNGIVDDPATLDYNEAELLIRLVDGTIRYTGPEHVVFNGTAFNDRMWGSEGDDTIRGNDGDDWMEGGDGNDNMIGGNGDDIMLDLGGDDNIKGGDGNDVISSGQGFGGDLNQGGRGHDFIVGGNDTTESFGGPGNDYIYAGDAEDTVFGDDGDDWLESGRGPFALIQGDNGAPFQDDPNQPGHDVLLGYGGEVDYDAEGGDDIMHMGPSIQRAEGMLGFDWSIHKGDPNPGDSDMAFTVLLPPTVDNNRDRFDLVEALSGWVRDDILKGDNRTAAEIAPGHTLNAAGIARIAGLADLLPPGATSFSDGNIILGGAGSDILEGRGGNDIIDGDRWLDVQIRVVTTDQFHDNMDTLKAPVLAGQINPANLEIVRSIKIAEPNPLHIDTAVFSGPFSDYDIVPNQNNSTTVIHARGTGLDGTDTLWNIEVLQFADQPVSIAGQGPFMIARSPVADTFVQGGSLNENQNFGINTVLRSQLHGGATGVSRTYLKFQIPPLPNFTPVESVKLRLYVLDASPNVQTVFAAGTAWSETSLTFNNAALQAPRGLELAAQPVPVGLNYVEITLPTESVPSDTEVAFEIVGGSDLALFHSREAAANRPQLLITLAGNAIQPPGAPTAVTALAGDGEAIVSWTAPLNDGGSPVTEYIVTASPGLVTRTTTGLSLIFDGLNNGTAYTFTVRASNIAGAGLASVPSNPVTPVAAPTLFTFTPVADAFVRSGGQANRNFGTATVLATRESGGNNIFRSYLKFDVSGLNGSPSTAVLRLFFTDPSVNLHSLRTLTGAWTETGITFNNVPTATINPIPVATVTPTVAGFIDIPLSITPVNGAISFEIQGSGNDPATFHSKEGLNDPQLVITQGP